MFYGNDCILQSSCYGIGLSDIQFFSVDLFLPLCLRTCVCFFLFWKQMHYGLCLVRKCFDDSFTVYKPIYIVQKVDLFLPLCLRTCVCFFLFWKQMHYGLCLVRKCFDDSFTVYKPIYIVQNQCVWDPKIGDELSQHHINLQCRPAANPWDIILVLFHSSDQHFWDITNIHMYYFL